ncbi:hypothetical protein [Borrelia sp. RT5S]|uniref:hypothetical protein n=1 Tax=Borrelia sp. RT5S TaxID=2898581 RepID=UPI001E48273E|nr:hypothetical protein [Borrelia sp. RT5S]UGQ16748.1 hypothetical protein LSO06_05355 [Borrelia sp. RT5S]
MYYVFRHIHCCLDVDLILDYQFKRELIMDETTGGDKISNLNNSTINLIKEVRSLDAYLANGITDPKTYKLRLNGRAKTFLKATLHI